MAEYSRYFITVPSVVMMMMMMITIKNHKIETDMGTACSTHREMKRSCNNTQNSDLET
jgi:hypothetical protein